MHRLQSGLRWLPGLMLTVALGVGLFAARGTDFAPVALATAASAQPVADPAGGTHLHGAGLPGGIAAQLSGNPTALAYCSSASLEPFDGALAQLQASGPDEAAERLRWCLMETLFGHTDRAVADELDVYAARFGDCYQPLGTSPAPSKAGAVTTVTDCVVAIAAQAP